MVFHQPGKSADFAHTYSGYTARAVAGAQSKEFRRGLGVISGAEHHGQPDYLESFSVADCYPASYASPAVARNRLPTFVNCRFLFACNDIFVADQILQQPSHTICSANDSGGGSPGTF